NAAAISHRRNRVSTTEVGGIDQALGTAAGGVDLGGEKLGVPGRVRHRLIGVVGVCGERVLVAGDVRGSGVACDVGVLIAGVDGEPGDLIGAIGAGEIGGIGEIVNNGRWVGARGCGYQTEESVGACLGAGSLLERIAGGGEVRRIGRTGNVDVVIRINRDSCQAVRSRTAQISEIHQLGRANVCVGGIDLG